MKKTFFILLFMIGLTPAFAQNENHKKAVDAFILQYNAGDFESIYQSFSTKMQKVHSKKYYFNFFSMVKKEEGNILFLELTDYREPSQNRSRATYDGHFENGLLDIWISVDGQNKIIGLYFKKKILI